MKDRVSPNTQAGGDKKNLSWMENEDLVLSVKDWASKTGESKYFSQYESISNINMLLDITSYSLSQFVSKYLCTNRPELAPHEIDTQEE